jgi:hypothetical protein
METALAEALYAALLRALPACARVWFGGLPRQLSGPIEEYTKYRVSPGLIDGNITAVQNAAADVKGDKAFGELSVKATRSTREVTALYKKDESSLELVRQLPWFNGLGVGLMRHHL